MRLLLGLIFISLSIQISAQEITGLVVDENGVGVENVHIFYPEILSGTSTDSLGFFSLKHIPQLKNVLISCIGYCDTTIAISELNKEKIRLKKKKYKIKEIAVVASAKDEIKVGCKKRKPNGINIILNKKNDNHGYYLFYFARNSYAKVKSISMHIRSYNGENIRLHFRVLAPDTTMKTLGSDMIYQDLSIPIQKGWNTIDLSNENVRFTKNGLIIAFSVSGINSGDFIDISGNANDDYSWMSSLDYKKDFGIQFRTEKKHKPAIQIIILE